MRHVLLALLIALLPLRGWVGDAMAVSLVAHPAVHAATHTLAPSETVADHCAEHPGHTGHTAHADQASPAQPFADAHHTSDAGTSPHPADQHPSHQHKACDVCNGPAMALSGVEAVALPLPHGVLATASVRFASTVLPQGIKPPIS
jgi:hypothetical protein